MTNKFSRADKRWRQLNEKAIKAAKKCDWFSAGTTYYEMAKQLTKEGKNNSKQKELGYIMKLRFTTQQLKEYKHSDLINKVETLATADSCQVCEDLEGEQFTISDALKKKPIPVRECFQEKGFGCRCTYIPVVE